MGSGGTYLLEIVSHSIVVQRQRENDQSIRDEVRRLLSNTGNLIESFISHNKIMADKFPANVLR